MVPLDSAGMNCYQSYHRFRDIAFDRSNITKLATPRAFNPLTEGLPWDDICEILTGGQQMARVQNGVETLPKI